MKISCPSITLLDGLSLIIELRIVALYTAIAEKILAYFPMMYYNVEVDTIYGVDVWSLMISCRSRGGVMWVTIICTRRM